MSKISRDSTASEVVLKHQGYEDFSKGTFGNGGQNIYVSKAGVLQRIHRFDFNCDGYADLLFVNSHDFNERVPAYVISNPLGDTSITELPTLGAYSGAVADLNGDGYDDLIIANQCNGTHSDITAFIYYGCPEGMSERYKMELPAPDARAVAVGDFNGDGRLDIAFACDGKIRVFYQGEKCFIPKQFVDIPITATHMCAADLDGDGYAELYVRVMQDRPRIFWGGPDGIKLDNFTLVGGEDKQATNIPSSTPGWLPFVEGWTAKIVKIGSIQYLFRNENNRASFYSVYPDRTLGEPLTFDCPDSVSAAVGDINGDGHEDLFIAVCKSIGDDEHSWIYWGSDKGFDSERRTSLDTKSARDVVVSDLDGDGCAEVIICQGKTDILNSTESLIFRGSPRGILPEPVRIPTHDATTALVARTCDTDHPQVVFINHVGGRVRGDIPVYAYLGGPDGFTVERRVELPGLSVAAAACCDFNDDGWPDIILCNSAENLLYSSVEEYEDAENAPIRDPGTTYIYIGGPNGFDQDRKVVLPTYRSHGVAVGDFRHSGYLDMVIGGFANPELLVFRGGDNGYDIENPQRIMLDPNLTEFTQSEDIPSLYNTLDKDCTQPRELFVADFNNDGWLDLFVSQTYGPQSFILWGGPEGFSMDRSTSLYLEGGSRVNAADLTGNGWLDLIVSGYMCPSKKFQYESYMYIYWGGPEGYREDRHTLLPARSTDAIAVADFNNDGILDISVCCYHAGRDRDSDSYIYWGMPGGQYSVENRSRLFGHSASGSMAADFNEDGWIDLAIAHHKAYGEHCGYSKVWWNGPEGFTPQNTTKLPTVGPQSMIAVDIGNIMDRSPEEHYISAPIELPEGTSICGITWEAELQPKTWVKAQIRSAESEEALEEALWNGKDGIDTWFECGDGIDGTIQQGRWMQYRLALGAVNSGNSPRLTSVSLICE